MRHFFFFSSNTGQTNSQFTQAKWENHFAGATWAQEPQGKLEVILFDTYANAEEQSRI